MLEKFENNVKLYTTSLKDKLLVINGATVTVGKKHSEDISAIYERISGLDSSFASYVDEHDAVHFSLSKVVEDVDASIAELKTSISQLDNKIYEKIEEQAESATAEFTNINTSITNVLDRISGLDTSVSALETTVAEENTRIDKLDSSVKAINIDLGVQFAGLIKCIDASFGEHLGYINALNTSVSGLESGLSTLESNVTDRLDGLDSSISAVETNISELVSKVDLDISTLKKEHNADVVAMSVNLGKLMDASFAEHLGYINALDASVSALESDMTEANDRIDSLNSSITSLIMSEGVNFAALTKCIDASFAEHKGYINTLNSSVSGLDSSVVDIINSIDSLDSSISALETKHDEDLAIRDTSIDEILTLLGTSTDSSTEPTIYGLFAKLNHIIEENEEIVAQALVDMDQRINNL